MRCLLCLKESNEGKVLYGVATNLHMPLFVLCPTCLQILDKDGCNILDDIMRELNGATCGGSWALSS